MCSSDLGVGDGGQLFLRGGTEAEDAVGIGDVKGLRELFDAHVVQMGRGGSGRRSRRGEFSVGHGICSG